MKTLSLICVGSVLLAWTAFSQTPTVSPAPSAIPSPSAVATISPATTASPESDLAGRIHHRMDQRLRQKGLSINLGDDDDGPGPRHSGTGDVPEAVIPLVAIIFMTIFGAPVLIVAVIMYFGFSRNRMMHRTIRMMVEKGQPVPPALLAPPPPAQRQRSDMRRGVVLVMIGLGLMLFFGAVNSWEGGSWAIGIVPFLIGAGYLLVWKLEGGAKAKADIPPALP